MRTNYYELVLAFLTLTQASVLAGSFTDANWVGLKSGMSGSTSDLYGPGPVVYSVACDSSGNLYAGGDFTNAGGVSANDIARWNGSAWTNLGSGMSDNVAAVACDSFGNVYAGGTFTNAGGVTANNIAKWNGCTWTNLGLGLDNWVDSLACDSFGNVYAGGFFTAAGGSAASHVAEWNGRYLDQPWIGS